MKKSNKKRNLIILTFLIVLILFIIFIVVNTKKDSEEVLVVECNKSVTAEGINTLFELYAYRIGDELKLVQNSVITFDAQINEEIFQSLVIYYEQQQEQRIETKFGSNYGYIDSSVSYKDQSLNSQIIYYINENSEKTIIDAFDYNFISASNEEISDYFEEDGYSCKIY